MSYFWTTGQVQTLRDMAGKYSYRAIALKLGKTRTAVHCYAWRLGLNITMPRLPANIDEVIRQKNAAGVFDKDIATEICVDRRTVTMRRNAMGLPKVKIAKEVYQKRHRKILRTAGVSCLAELRDETVSLGIFRDGWPIGLRQVQGRILTILESGPKSTTEIIAALGRKEDGNIRMAGSRHPLAPMQKAGYVSSYFVGHVKFWKLEIKRRIYGDAATDPYANQRERSEKQRDRRIAAMFEKASAA